MFQHDFPFDPTYGYDLDALLEVPAPAGPDDFDEFWRRTFQKALAVPLNVSREELLCPRPGYRLFKVLYDSLGGVRIGSWLLIPKDGEINQGAVYGHGYGGREAPEYDHPFEKAAVIFPCARGFHLSAHPDYPANGHEHVMCGIESRDTYSHRGSVADFWIGASALLELYPESGAKLSYVGGSFGGGIGALLLPWDERFSRAHLGVPSFGNHPLRISLPCMGSGQSVQNYYPEHPEILEVLQYFDAATAASRIHIPVLASPALFDPAVPPPGQFSVYNALSGPKELFVQQAGHFEWGRGQVEEGRTFAQVLKRWFS